MSVIVILSRPKCVDFSTQQSHSRFNKHGLSSHSCKRLTKKKLIVHISVPVVSQFKMSETGSRESRTVLESWGELTVLHFGEVCYNLGGPWELYRVIKCALRVTTWGWFLRSTVLSFIKRLLLDPYIPRKLREMKL